MTADIEYILRDVGGWSSMDCDDVAALIYSHYPKFLAVLQELHESLAITELVKAEEIDD